jgi:predicted aldo/keto reductase-like oxidoreductase
MKVKTWPTNFAVLTSSDFTPEVLNGEASDREAFVCFKCHSAAAGPLRSVTTSSGTYTQSDLAQQFNPNNFSAHNVTGQSKGMNRNANVSDQYTYTDSGGTLRTQTWAVPTANVFAGAWNSNSKVTCSDCHTGGGASQAIGPHGSTVAWMIDPAYPTDWKTITYTNRANATYICNKCHNISTASNSAHRSDHNSYTCTTCHIAIPHGWKRPRMLLASTYDLTVANYDRYVSSPCDH